MMSSLRPPPRALLLDLDGTLADSLGVMNTVYERFLTLHGCDPSPQEFAQLNGPPLAAVVRSLKANHGLSKSYPRLLRHYQELVSQCYTTVAPMTGATELIQHAQRKGCLVGVVTSNSGEEARAWLKRVRLLDFIAVVVAGEDVSKGKPDPQPYIAATQRIDCPKDTIVAVEDSTLGARSAYQAGIRTFLLDATGAIAIPEGVEPLSSLSTLRTLLWEGA